MKTASFAVACLLTLTTLSAMSFGDDFERGRGSSNRSYAYRAAQDHLDSHSTMRGHSNWQGNSSWQGGSRNQFNSDPWYFDTRNRSFNTWYDQGRSYQSSYRYNYQYRPSHGGNCSPNYGSNFNYRPNWNYPSLNSYPSNNGLYYQGNGFGFWIN